MRCALACDGNTGLGVRRLGCLAPTSGDYAFAHRTMFHLKAGSERRVFNNIFVYLNEDGRYPTPFYGLNATNLDLQIDGTTQSGPNGVGAGANVGSNNATARNLYTFDDHVFLLSLAPPNSSRHMAPDAPVQR